MSLAAPLGMEAAAPYRDAQEHLRDYLDRIGCLFDSSDSLEPVLARDAAIAAREAATELALPLLALRDRTGLDLAALHVLVTAAAPVLDGELGARVRERILGTTPTVEELVALLACSGEDEAALHAALGDDAPLVAFGLIELVGDVTFAQRGVRVDDRVAAFLRGDDVFDHRLRGIAELHFGFASPHVPAATDVLQHVLATPGPVVIEGPAGVGKATAAIAAAAALGRRTIVVALDALVAAREPLHAFAWARREALLQGALLVLRVRELPDGLSPALRYELVQALQSGFAIAGARDGELLCRLLHGPRRVRIALPTLPEQAMLWRSVVGAHVPVEAVCERYPLPAGDILAAAASARAACTLAGRGVELADAIAAARARLEHRLGDVAQLVTTTLAWNDVVLPADVVARIREIVDGVRHRDTVMNRWGFAAKLPYGRASTALFSGPPGTGKTMLATLIGKELGLEVFRVDLSKVVSKYIGETERNLDRVFGEASRCQALLLFDEADSLFARRTEVKTSNDRYANLEVNFLLQRLEAHDGIVILATNAGTAIDPAFLRRLRYRIELALPDEHERARLWRAMIPRAMPCAGDIDFAELGRRFPMTGGHIKNAVVRAAYVAAAEDHAQLTYATLVRAATLEWTELGRLQAPPPSPSPEGEDDAAPDEPLVTLRPLVTARVPLRAKPAFPLAAGVEAKLIEILGRPLTSSETVDAGYARKEREIGELFGALPVPEAMQLHARLRSATSGDALALHFERLAAPRRSRLLAYLADARRRDAHRPRHRNA